MSFTLFKAIPIFKTLKGEYEIWLQVSNPLFYCFRFQNNCYALSGI